MITKLRVKIKTKIFAEREGFEPSVQIEVRTTV
jgi:hypothetical protein